jgi:pilus assembly protein CpaE
MLLTADQSPELLIRAMRAGVREVLSLPIDHKAFNEALDRVVQKASAFRRQGKVISFISCKGGSGATFLAANFGHALAELGKKKVLLIDLNQQFGDAALYVSDKKPAMTLADVCQQIDRLDSAFLESSLVSVSSNFSILAASDDPTHAVDIEPEHIDTLLRLAREHYDFIILDMGRQLDNVAIRALDECDVIYPVLQLALPYIRDGQRLLDIFRSLGYPRDKARLIVNRFEKSSKVRLSDLESTLGTSVAHTIPNDYQAATDSINQGIPILNLYRNNPVTKGLISIVDQTAGSRKTEDKKIFGRMFFNRSVQANA